MLLSTLYAKGTRSQDSIDEAGMICAQVRGATAPSRLQSNADTAKLTVCEGRVL